MNSDETSEPDSVDEPVSEETGVNDAESPADPSVEQDRSEEVRADPEEPADSDPADGESGATTFGWKSFRNRASRTKSGETSADEDAVDTERETESDSPRHWAASMVLAVAVAALVAAVVCLGYFGYTGIRAYTVDSTREEMRVEAVNGAEQAMLNILTVDDQGVDVWQKRMKSSLTGDALKQAIDETSGGAVKQIEAAKNNDLTIKATIERSAVTELNPDEDTATVFVLSQAATSEAPNQPQPQSSLLSMVRVDGAWKADKIVPLTDITYYDDTAQPTTGPQGGQQQGGGN